MAFSMSETVEINRPAAEVFAYLTDLNNAPKWQKTVVEAKYTSEGCGTTKLGSPPVHQIGNRNDLIFVPHNLPLGPLRLIDASRDARIVFVGEPPGPTTRWARDAECLSRAELVADSAGYCTLLHGGGGHRRTGRGLEEDRQRTGSGQGCDSQGTGAGQPRDRALRVGGEVLYT